MVQFGVQRPGAQVGFQAAAKPSAPSQAQGSAINPLAATTATDTLTLNTTPKFGSKLDKNHGVEYPIDVDLDFEQSGQAQRALTLKNIEMLGKGDRSHLVFSVDMMPGFNFPAPLKGLTDTLTMSQVPVDTLVKTSTDLNGLRVLQAATGKRYINAHASIAMGPAEAASGGSTKDARVRLRIFNEDQRNLEALIMKTTGKANRREVYDDLQSGEEFNALRSLAYGKKGLVDAVIVGHDQILTRPVLDKFYAAHGLAGNGKQKQDARGAFNKEYQSLDAVATWASKQGLLERFDPASLTPNPTPLGNSVQDELDEKSQGNVQADKSADGAANDNQQKIAELFKQLQALMGQTPAEEGSTSSPKSESQDDEETQFHFEKYGMPISTSDLPRRLKISDDAKTGDIEIQNVPDVLRSNTFARDSVVFPGGFDFDILPQTEAALRAIYEKKEKALAQGKPVSNALIVENSPGGIIWVAEQLKDQIHTAPVPTDVIVQGWGCSCGSMLAAMATGNVFATPNAGILLHEASGGSRGDVDKVNKDFRSLEYANTGYKQLIAKRTGRSYEEINKDFKVDFDLNAVESILYGPKGLLDGILVGPNKVLTRDAVMDFVIEQKGSRKAAEKYIEEKFVQRREGDYAADLNEHKEINEDPLANPLQVIQTLVKRGKAVSLSSQERFQASTSDVAGDPSRTMHLYKVAEEPVHAH